MILVFCSGLILPQSSTSSHSSFCWRREPLTINSSSDPAHDFNPSLSLWRQHPIDWVSILCRTRLVSRTNSPIISPDLESGPIANFRLRIVRELWDRASKRHLIQAQSAL